MNRLLNEPRWRALFLGGVFLAALTVNLVLGFKLGMTKPMASDAKLYLQIAQSVAAGDGYCLREGFWPDVPTMSRAPGWPYFVSLMLRLVPGVSPDLLMRCVNLVLNSIVAVLVAMLASRIIERRQWVIWPGVIAGVIYILYPVALYEAYEGMSELLFLVLILGGTLLLLGKTETVAGMDATHPPLRGPLQGGDLVYGVAAPQLPSLEGSAQRGVGLVRCEPPLGCLQFWPKAAGILLLGLACLVRPNFILWIGFVIVLLGWRAIRERTCSRAEECEQKTAKNAKEEGCCACGEIEEAPGADQPIPAGAAKPRTPLRSLRASVQTLFLVCIFLLPSALWALRNYHVCGHFPVLSTLRGQTFYGGNNPVVAGTREYWGYWVFPNSIPGEKPMYELSRTLSEYDVDAYYFQKGKRFVIEHWREMPVLLVGKLVRAYVPVPWKFSWSAALVAVFRWCLYLLAGFGLWRFWRNLAVTFKIMLGAMMASNLTLVLSFYGYNRFAFEVDPFLMPFAAASLCLMVSKVTSSRHNV